jgi:hypothetical protein
MEIYGVLKLQNNIPSEIEEILEEDELEEFQGERIAVKISFGKKDDYKQENHFNFNGKNYIWIITNDGQETILPA